MTVEVHVAGGFTTLSIVGLPEMAVKENKERGHGALLNSRFQFPISRVTINLAPADLPKEEGCFDLPIAAGVLGASGQLKCDLLGRLELLGELPSQGTGGRRPWWHGIRVGRSSCRAKTRMRRP